MTTSPPPSSRRRRFRRRLVYGATTVLLVLLAGPAHALWTATSTGPYALAQAGTLAAPSLTVGSLTPTSATLAWTKPFAPTGYALSQTPGTLAGCSTTPASGSSGCTATGLTPNTSYTWNITAYLNNWFSQTSVTGTTSRQATATTLSAITPTTGTAGTNFSATATVAGSSGYGTPAGTAQFALFTSSTCTGTAAYTSAAQTLTAGSTTATLQPAAGTYYWQATYTPTDTYNLASTSACSAAIIVTPAGGTFAGVGTPVSRTNSGNNVSSTTPPVPRRATWCCSWCSTTPRRTPPSDQPAGHRSPTPTEATSSSSPGGTRRAPSHL